MNNFYLSGFNYMALILLLMLTQCSGSKTLSGNANNDLNHPIIFIQNGEEQLITKAESAIEIERTGFSIKFYCKRYNSERKEFHATQIAAVIDEDLLVYADEGMEINKTTFFMPGTGMAPSESGFYSHLYIEEQYGHHYIFYEDETPRGRRAKLLGSEGELLNLEIDVASLHIDGKGQSLKDVGTDKLFLVILTDLNKNGTIDEGELAKVKITFKES